MTRILPDPADSEDPLHRLMTHGNHRAVALAIGFCILLTVALGLQVASGAFVGELSVPDEAAHYVTGLMVHDYVASGAKSSPMAFATNYYAHYPKVAFGIWPPLFHVVEAVWMFVAPNSPASVLVMVAVLVALLATTVFGVARREFDTAGGFAVALLFLLLPATQFSVTRLHADAQVALLSFWAALCWGRYLDRHRWQDSLAFGVLGSLSMLTKGNGNALFALPLIAALLGGQVHLLRRAAFWLGLSVMLAIGVPWQVYSWTIVRQTVSLQPNLWRHLVAYLMMMPAESGATALVVGLVGLGSILWRARREHSMPGCWSSVIALPAAVILFHAIVPLNPSGRYLLPAMPSMALLVGAGVQWVTRLPALGTRVSARSKSIAIAGLVAVAFVAGTFRIQPKRHYGFAEIAETLLEHSSRRNPVVLVSSRGEGDGMLISEVASREPRPGSFILRADKMLARSSWDGAHYELLYTDPAEINGYLLSVPVEYVVIDMVSSRFDNPHHRLLIDTMNRYQDDWKVVDSYPRDRSARPNIVVYRSTHPSAQPMQIEIDMRYSLGRTIIVR